MKVKELIQRVQALYSKSPKNKDTKISARRIYSKLTSSRAKLIVYKVNKRQKISQWYYQNLNCIEMQEVPIHQCPCVPPSGCTILRSKEELPKPLTGLTYGHMLQSVTSLEGDIIYSETTWNDKKYKKGSKYTSRKPDYFIKDNYLYITCTTKPKVITVIGLFEDPLVESTYINFCGGSSIDPCQSFLDMEFPVEQDMIDTLVEMAHQELTGNFPQGRDTRNYDPDEQEQQVQNQQRQRR